MDRNPLFSVPGLGGYLGAQQFDRQNQMGQLQQINSLVALQRVMQEQEAQARAQQEQQQLQGTLRGAANPQQAIERLIASGNPKAIEIAAKLKSLMPPPPQDRVVAPGGAIVAPDGTVKYQAPMKPDKPPEIIQLTEMFNSLPDGDPRRPILQKAIEARTFGREDAIRLAAALRPAPQEPMVPVKQPDGSSIYMPRSQAAGMTVGGGAAPKVSPMEKATYDAGLKDLQRDEKDLANVSQLETALKRWSELNATTETGRIVGYRPAVGQPQLQELQQLQNYLAVNNFKPGQGQISNFERQLIKGAGPNVTNDRTTNDRIVQIQLGAVQNARDRAAFREYYLENNKKLLGADKAWIEYIEKNPRFIKGKDGEVIPNPARKDWTEYFGVQGGAPSNPRPPANPGANIPPPPPGFNMDN